ncbi:MAG TPA: MFS transporter, partial [Chloroflexota bacterium]|nr:MFS transporter [Chloroflexota bacterium]
VTVTHLVVDACATTVPALLPFWQVRFGLTYGLAGLITAVANLTSSVAQPVVGLLTDRGRDARWIALAVAVAAVGAGLTGVAPQYGVFLGLVVVGGLGVSAFHPQGYKYVGLYGGARPAVATSWFLVGGNVGVAFGPLFGTAAAVHFGPGGTLYLILPGLLLAGALLWLVPRWTQGRRLVGAHGGLVAPETVGEPVDAPAAPMSRLPLPRRSVMLAVLVAVVALRSTVSGALTSFVPLYYVGVVGASETVASGVLAGMLLIGAAATLAGGYLADRFGRLRVLAITLLLTPPLLLLFLAAPPGSPLAVGALWAGGAMLTASFAVPVVLAQELWFERRALASGVIVGFAFGLGGLFVPVIGVIADRAGLVTALQVVAFFPLLALALTGVLALLGRPARAGAARG